MALIPNGTSQSSGLLFNKPDDAANEHRAPQRSQDHQFKHFATSFLLNQSVHRPNLR